MAYIIRNNVKYAGGSGSGGNTNSVDLTMAEYLELEKNGQVVEYTTYYITDESVGNEIDAELVMFDDTNTQMGVDNVQDAVENINTQVSELNKNLGFESGSLTLKGTECCTVTDFNGTYTKIGKLVFLDIEFAIAGNGNTTMYIDCLPYPTKSTSSFVLGYANAIFKNPTDNKVFTSLYAGAWTNTTRLFLGGSLDGRNWTFEGSVCASSGTVNISGFYEIAE